MGYVYRLEGVPIPQKRPRLGKGIVYNPCANDKKKHKAFINIQHLQRCQEEEIEYKPLDTALIGFFIFTFPEPKAKKKYHTSKPDVDNLLKYILDVGNGIIYKDDSQFIKCMIEKQFGQPSTQFMVYEYDEFNEIYKKKNED